MLHKAWVGYETCNRAKFEAVMLTANNVPRMSVYLAGMGFAPYLVSQPLTYPKSAQHSPLSQTSILGWVNLCPTGVPSLLN